MNRRNYRANQVQTREDLYAPQEQNEPRGGTPLQAAERPRMMAQQQAPSGSTDKKPDTGTQENTQPQQPQTQPQGFQSSWEDQIYGIMDQILNREKFSYDLNADALYQQYAQQYAQQGKLAMMDTMGQAAAMTGGYGSSYAQAAGQQAYQGYLQRLNDVIPELYGMARDQYDQEGQNLLNQYGLLADQEQTDYDRYRDQVADERWEKEYEEDLRRWNFANGITTEEEGSSGSGGNGGNGGGGSTVYDNGGLNDYGIRALQSALGVTVDGQWGPETAAAAMDKWGVSTPEEAYQFVTGGVDQDMDGWKDAPPAEVDYYEQLLGAVSTATGAYNKQDYKTRQEIYQEAVENINDAYESGKITEEQRATLLRIAMPGGR